MNRSPTMSSFEHTNTNTNTNMLSNENTNTPSKKHILTGEQFWEMMKDSDSESDIENIDDNENIYDEQDIHNEIIKTNNEICNFIQKNKNLMKYSELTDIQLIKKFASPEYSNAKINNIPYQTQVNLTPDKKIIAFSDVHADIHSLIIALRDCAGVIRKKTPNEFNNANPDPELEKYLFYDLNLNLKDYKNDLGYEWVSNNTTHVVIVGDIIDGKNRNGFDGPKKTANKRNNKGSEMEIEMDEHEYPQIEIKILKFINALNESAIAQGGRIFKLLGNHEVMNMIPGYNNENYIFENDLNNRNYYMGFTRDDVFKCGNPGFIELFKDGCGALLMMNNYIFVHGQLVGLNFNEYDKINWILNNPIVKKSTFEQVLNTLNAGDVEQMSQKTNSQLWCRNYGYFTVTDERNDNPEKKNKFCNQTVKTNFEQFLQQTNLVDVSGHLLKPDELKIVIGHCPQYFSTVNYHTNTTFDTVEYSDSVKKILSGKSKTGYPNYDSKTDFIFGISMECEMASLTSTSTPTHKIFKVDIGSSRSFDSIKDYDKIVNSLDPNNKEHQYHYSRTPQVLEIFNNVEKIIKSTISNTRIHQPRYTFEKLIDDTVKRGEMAKKLKLDSDNYKTKYLKYKQKYLNLKKNN